MNLFYLLPSRQTRCVVWLCLLASTSIVGADEMSPTDQAKSLSVAFRKAAQAVKPAVVTINTSYKLTPELQTKLQEELRRPGAPLPFPREEGEPDALGQPTSVGSGVVVDADGVVLTNNHVVQLAHEVLVRLADGSEYKAVDIRTDPDSDLAVLRIQADKKLPFAVLGDSSQLEIGDWVIAIGSPFDLEATVSAGIISANGRNLPLIRRSRLLQTDAAINPGNSGGPLVNLNGEVVGINTSIATHNGSFQGVGFAIPVTQAKWIYKELLEHGKVRRAWLGVSIGELTADAARKMKLPARAGVWVQRVAPNSPAGKAGLKIDDVIVEFGKVHLLAPGDLQEAVEQQPFGSKQAMRVLRDGKPLTLDITVEPLPDDPAKEFLSENSQEGKSFEKSDSRKKIDPKK